MFQIQKKSNHFNKSNSICNYSKLDLDKMSLSNNLSELQPKKEEIEEINLYSNMNSANEIIQIPISDPKLSNKKIITNKKIKDYLDKEAQNLSNKSFISLKENRELFSRKNSSLQESAKINCKNVKMRLMKKNSNPKQFKFQDILEGNMSQDIAILEYQSDSQIKGLSFQSMKNNENYCLPPSKAVSYMTGKSEISNIVFNKNLNLKEKKFEHFEKLCNEIFSELIEKSFKNLKNEKIQKSKEIQIQNNKNKKQKFLFEQNFEKKIIDFLKNINFPLKSPFEQVSDFLNGYSEFLCKNKLSSIVQNINKCKKIFHKIILKITDLHQMKFYNNREQKKV